MLDAVEAGWGGHLIALAEPISSIEPGLHRRPVAAIGERWIYRRETGFGYCGKRELKLLGG